MIGRVLYGLARQGNLPDFFSRIDPRTNTPVVATLIGVAAILILALTVPLVGLADLTSRLTLAIFAVVNVALIRIKMRGDPAPADSFTCPIWVPISGLISTTVLLFVDQVSW
jgi:APA family basic amino acid/polyamine antiporter